MSDTITTLMRGSYELPHQAQMIRRDVHGEKIVRHPGGKAWGYRLTAEQMTEDRFQRYEFLIHSPESLAMSWTAFTNREELGKFLDAYGLQLNHEPEPGDRFWVEFPFDATVWQPLNDPTIPDPVCPPPRPEPTPTELDEKDAEILARRVALLEERTAPKVGDWVQFADGKMRRISHIWDWNDGDPAFPLAQTSDGGSYYLGDGYVSMSGSLHPSVHTNTLTETGLRKMGSVWFFHHDYARAHNGIDTVIPFRVWTCSVEAPE